MQRCPDFHAAPVAPQDPRAMDETETPGLLQGPALGTCLPLPYSKTESGDVVSSDLEAPMVLMLLRWEIPRESPETTPKAVAGVLGRGAVAAAHRSPCFAYTAPLR